MASGVSPSSRWNSSTGVGARRRIHSAQSRMMPGRLKRIRQLTFEEAHWRTRELVATLRDRLRIRIRRPQWPEACNSSIAADVIGRLHAGQSRCVINPCLAHVVREEVVSRFPNAVADAAIRGDRLLDGEHDLLGYRALMI